MGAGGSSPSPLSSSKVCGVRFGSSELRRSLNRRHRFIKLLEKSFLVKKSFAHSLTTKNSDYTARVFRDLINYWPLEDLEALFAEFESANVVRNLFLRYVSTRAKAPRLAEQMLEALNGAVRSDFVISFKGEAFEVHKSVLIARSGYFADLLSPGLAIDGPSCSFRVESSFDLELPASFDVPRPVFEKFLRFIYTGELPKDCDVVPLAEYFRCRQESYIEDFARFASRAEASGDCQLAFSSRSFSPEKRDPRKHTVDYITRSDATFLSIRSSYFRSLFARRRKEDDEDFSVTIDENLIPRAYVPVLLHAVYTDQLDLGRLLCSTPLSSNSLCEVQAMVSGKDPNSPINRATELYQIATFLNFYHLAQQCEDVIVRNLNVDNLVPVYNWAAEEGGSKYVRRHCLNMLFADFARVANSHCLLEMSEELLYECISSDFVEASELEMLNAVIRWGEEQVYRRRAGLAEASTSGTSSPGTTLRRSSRRKIASTDRELKALVGDLLSLIRTPFIIPPFHQSLNEVYKRDLLTRHPYRHGSTTSSGVESNPDGHWFNFAQMSSNCSDSDAFLVGPRFLRVYQSELMDIIKMRYSALGREWKPPTPCGDLFSPSDVILVNNEPDILEQEEWNRIRRRFYEILRECRGIRYLCVCNCSHHLNSAIDQIRNITALELNVDDALLGVEMRPHSTRSLGTGRRRDLGCKLKHHFVTMASSENIFIEGAEKPSSSGRNESIASVQPDLVASGNGKK